MAPLTAEEQHGLDLVSSVLDSVPWSYWKPGEQPARILDWLFLGDLADATDLGLLEQRQIQGVLNLIGWWELEALLPEGTDLEILFSHYDIEYKEADSEDRLFVDIIATSWPSAERFLQRCRDEGRKVLVNCQAGHNRSACIMICWLMARENFSLLGALEHVQRLRGTVLSNHGFRLQLVRLALQLGKLGGADFQKAREEKASEPLAGSGGLQKIINTKRLSVKYGHNSKDFERQPIKKALKEASLIDRNSKSVISNEVSGLVSQRKLSLELVACLTHWNKNFLDHYEYTADPPVVVGRGFSGDVVLCQRRNARDFGGRPQNSLRCVKRFNLTSMKPDHLEKLKNEAVIYLSLEHPHIARLFDVYEDDEELSLVMQYCGGGTLQDVLRSKGPFPEPDFKQAAVQMLRVLNYVHRAGIVHRDIKPRNWVYEAERNILKLIDFGFSAKCLMLHEGRGAKIEGSAELKGCLGTLGYLAPEVISSAASSEAYSEKCDIWSLGVVLLELLRGVCVFEREGGGCDGYTEEVILREIQDVSSQDIAKHLDLVPSNARAFLARLLTKEPSSRPSAQDLLEDPYLQDARAKLLWQPDALQVSEVLSRFRIYGSSSATTRASMLAVARAPTRLPWRDFCALRATFDVFDEKLKGTVDLEAFLSVVCSPDACPATQAQAREEALMIWKAVCGEEEALSYCEFLAALMPWIDDPFQDVSKEAEAVDDDATPSSWPRSHVDQRLWDLSQPVATLLPLLETRRNLQDMVFPEDQPVCDVVRCMSKYHFRWVVVQFRSGRKEFFDYMDLCHEIVTRANSRGRITSDQAKQISRMSVGVLANCSGYSAFVPTAVTSSLKSVLQLLSRPGEGRNVVHRVPLVDAEGELVRVFSCIDFLDLALRFDTPSAVLKSREARTFDRRNAVLQALSVPRDDTVLHALQIMDAEKLTICPATSQELSGDMGGAVAVGVVAVADLKLVFESDEYHVLDYSIDDFLCWRQRVVAVDSAKMVRYQSLRRFNVVSVDHHETLHVLATRLLASKLQRLFLSSNEIARIVGIVSSREILIEVFDQLLHTSSLSSRFDGSLRNRVAD